jgi:hypothetical protein
MDTPQLRDVLNFPGYLVGDDGSVWTYKLKGGNDRTPGRTGELRPLKIHRDKKGYCRVNLDRGGKTHSRLVHQLVLEAFIGPRPPGMEGCHYPDPNKGNNRVGNLRWDTHGENAKDKYRDRPPVTEKRCRRCGETKPASDFYREKRASDGLKTECKECHKRTTMESRDPEKKRAANREYMRRWRREKTD